MIVGSVTVTPHTVETHRASYRLEELNVVAMERPLLPVSLMGALGGTGFGVSFGDLLYPGEIAGLAGAVAFGLLAGFRLARIQLLSRDLRGSELSCMIWGTWGHLQRVRREIAAAREAAALHAQGGGR